MLENVKGAPLHAMVPVQVSARLQGCTALADPVAGRMDPARAAAALRPSWGRS